MTLEEFMATKKTLRRSVKSRDGYSYLGEYIIELADSPERWTLILGNTEHCSANLRTLEKMLFAHVREN